MGMIATKDILGPMGATPGRWTPWVTDVAERPRTGYGVINTSFPLANVNKASFVQNDPPSIQNRNVCGDLESSMIASISGTGGPHLPCG